MPDVCGGMADTVGKTHPDRRESDAAIINGER